MTYDLFADEPANAESGVEISMPDAKVIHFPRLFTLSEADELFSRLQQEVKWQQEKITLYGQEHNVPRLTAWYGEPNKTYTYSGISVRSLDWISPLLLIKNRVEDISDCSFNSVLLNRYRNGSDSVSWHADDEPELGENPLIGSVSFGEARPFQMKHKKNPHDTRKITLEHGSYLIMKGSTQHHWLHQIPKSKRELGERINLTFRNIIEENFYNQLDTMPAQR